MTDGIHWDEGIPIYLQLKAHITEQMLDGNLNIGEPLPSIRQVAAEYHLNPLTVSRAYRELADEVLIEKRRGLGMFVTDAGLKKLRNNERERFIKEQWPAVLKRMRRLDITLDELLSTPAEPFA